VRSYWLLSDISWLEEVRNDYGLRIPVVARLELGETAKVFKRNRDMIVIRHDAGEMLLPITQRAAARPFELYRENPFRPAKPEVAQRLRSDILKWCRDNPFRPPLERDGKLAGTSLAIEVLGMAKKRGVLSMVVPLFENVCEQAKLEWGSQTVCEMKKDGVAVRLPDIEKFIGYPP